MKTTLKILFSAALLALAAYFVATKTNLNPAMKVGQKIDSLNGVYVYYNGGVGNSDGRNLAKDGYNLGIKYQCVEFVKRYYYEVYHHRMPEDRGNAKDFFDRKLQNADFNEKRGLEQYKNGYGTPEVGDLVVFVPTVFNRFGHVAIVSDMKIFELEIAGSDETVREGTIEIIQQNAGPFAETRETYTMKETPHGWKINNDRIYGWLRAEHIEGKPAHSQNK